VIAYRATLDVPRKVVSSFAKMLAPARRLCGTPRGSRALSCFWAGRCWVRWFGDRTAADALAVLMASRGPPLTATSTIEFQAGRQTITKTITAADPLPGDLCQALDAINPDD
jgi:hypothetical protein